MSSPAASATPIQTAPPIVTLPPPQNHSGMDTINLIVAFSVVFALVVCFFIISIWLSRRRLFGPMSQTAGDAMTFAWWPGGMVADNHDLEAAVAAARRQGNNGRAGRSTKKRIKQQKPVLWDTVAIPYYCDVKSSTDNIGHWDGIVPISATSSPTITHSFASTKSVLSPPNASRNPHSQLTVSIAIAMPSPPSAKPPSSSPVFSHDYALGITDVLLPSRSTSAIDPYFQTDEEKAREAFHELTVNAMLYSPPIL